MLVVIQRWPFRFCFNLNLNHFSMRLMMIIRLVAAHPSILWDPLPHLISRHTKWSKIRLTANSLYVRLQCAVSVPLILYNISQLKPFMKYFLVAPPVRATGTQRIPALTWENQKSGNYSISVLRFNFRPIRVIKWRNQELSMMLHLLRFFFTFSINWTKNKRF